MLADYHLHTNASDDSKMTMESYVKQAIELGFDEICFTDHVEYAMKNKIVRNEVDYYQNYLDLMENFDENLTVKFGAEFGIQRDNIDFYNEFFEKYPFDFILLSCHTVDNFELYDGTYQKGKTQQEYNEAYYEQLLYVVKNYKKYSVLAHLDLIKRYDKSPYPFEKTYPFVYEILKQVVADGKGLEINTSSFRYNIGDLTPSVEILKLFKELGGEIITIGSDSHVLSHFGKYIKEVRTQLLDLGFKYFYTFEKMNPIRHSLAFNEVELNIK